MPVWIVVTVLLAAWWEQRSAAPCLAAENLIGNAPRTILDLN